jgi:hypothetical protein
MESAVRFLFILLLPLLIVAGTLAGLFGVGGFFYALSNPDDIRRLAGRFRRRQPQS